MGVSTDGILFYGFLVPDWDEAIPIPEHAEDDEDFYVEDWVEAILEKHDCRLVTHCSYDYPMYAITTHDYKAWRGCPKLLTADDVDAESDSGERLIAASKDLGVEAKDIGWHLASLWG